MTPAAKPILRTLLLVLPLLAAAAFPAFARCSGTPPELMAPYVEGIQRQLLQLGYQPGRNDGKLGGRTVAAIRDYQRRAGLPVDGCPSKELLDQMSFAAPPQAVHRAAVTPSPVQEVQRLLTDKGFYAGRVDGRSGPKTRAAIRSFQQARNLPATGDADFQTLQALRDPQR